MQKASLAGALEPGESAKDHGKVLGLEAVQVALQLQMCGELPQQHSVCGLQLAQGPHQASHLLGRQVGKHLWRRWCPRAKGGHKIETVLCSENSSEMGSKEGLEKKIPIKSEKQCP